MDKALFAGLAIVALLVLVRVGVGAVRPIWMLIPVVVKVLETLATCDQLVTQVGRIIDLFRNLFRHVPGRDDAELEGGERFTLAEIRRITNNFAHAHYIAEGDSGKVYKGKLHDGRHVAVKRLKHGGRRSAEATFVRELTLLRPLRHEHIVRLLGSCEEEGKRILVYEHMDRGTLRDLLDQASPSWRRRVKVLLGAARGIKHLHCNAVIHGNVTSSNILLSRSLVPRLSGFGASARGKWSQPVDVFQTNGYADPEYHRTRLLRRRTDVYSLGVVMLEVLTGKQPVLARGTTLVSWALPSIDAGRLGDVVDRRPASEPTPSLHRALWRVAETAASCLSVDGDRRPAIPQVVENLEEAIKLICTDE